MREGPLKDLIRRVLRLSGYQLERYSPDPLETLVSLMRQMGVETVLDVGANVGEYAQTVRDLGFEGKIWSFEPLPEPFAVSSAQAATDPHWEVMNVGLGLLNEHTEMYVTSGDQAASSIHKMLPRHRQGAPGITVQKVLSCEFRRLDDLIHELDAPAPLFVKVDTQGHELQVLEGSEQILANGVVGVQVEVSILPLYSGAATLAEIFNWMNQRDFVPTWAASGFRDTTTGELLQIDVLFTRAKQASF